MESTTINTTIDINEIIKYNHQLVNPSSIYPFRQTYLDSFKAGEYSLLVKTFYKKEWKSIMKTILIGWISVDIRNKIKSLIK